MKKKKELTRAEEEIMQILWKIESGFVKDILAEFSAPRPAYNTVSTIVRILETKGFVKHKAHGKTHEYFPAVGKEEYLKSTVKSMMKGYFGNSFKNLLSFFVEQGQVSLGDIDDLVKDIRKDKKSEKKKKKKKK